MNRVLVSVVAVLALVLGTGGSAAAQSCGKPCRMKQLMVYSEGEDWRGVPERRYAKLGRGICRSLRNGYSKVQMVEVGEDSGFSQREAIALVAASVVVFCPNQE